MDECSVDPVASKPLDTDEPELGSSPVTQLLDSIPEAFESAQVGLAEANAGLAIPLEDL